jgi:hypothetical protein
MRTARNMPAGEKVDAHSELFKNFLLFQLITCTMGLMDNAVMEEGNYRK